MLLSHAAASLTTSTRTVLSGPIAPRLGRIRVEQGYDQQAKILNIKRRSHIDSHGTYPNWQKHGSDKMIRPNTNLLLLFSPFLAAAAHLMVSSSVGYSQPFGSRDEVASKNIFL